MEKKFFVHLLLAASQRTEELLFDLFVQYLHRVFGREGGRIASGVWLRLEGDQEEWDNTCLRVNNEHLMKSHQSPLFMAFINYIIAIASLNQSSTRHKMRLHLAPAQVCHESRLL